MTFDKLFDLSPYRDPQTVAALCSLIDVRNALVDMRADAETFEMRRWIMETIAEMDHWIATAPEHVRAEARQRKLLP